MYHRERRKIFVTFLFASCILPISPKSIENPEKTTLDPIRDNFENNIIDFDEDHTLKFNKKYGIVPWESNEKFNKETHRYTLVKDNNTTTNSVQNDIEVSTVTSAEQSTLDNDYSVIPLELLSTTEDALISIIESTTEYDLTVIPLSTTEKVTPTIVINETITLPTSTENSESTTEYELSDKILLETDNSETTTIKRDVTHDKSNNETVTEIPLDRDVTHDRSNNETVTKIPLDRDVTHDKSNNETVTEIPLDILNVTTTIYAETSENQTKPILNKKYDINEDIQNSTDKNTNQTKIHEVINTNSSVSIEIYHPDNSESQEDVPSFSELDAVDQIDVPEDYYDNKDVLPTTAPKTDALSVIFGVAGSLVESVVESVAERVVPKSIYDLFKRMQRQSEALEAERLRSREENGGLGQFGRGILKSISSDLSKPLSQLMQGVKDIGSLDNDRGFVSSVASSVASGVTTVATSVSDAFKIQVQAIYPGTVWCGDGRSPTARSSDLGLFFFTDTCCRQHDACKIFIKAGDTKYGLTNTGLFTRSHCSCDAKFRDCLRKTNSLVSAQIGLTYFNVLGPQCFRKAHPIIKCVRKTRITGQKCEEYELDYTKPKMWQWFDNETF